jgi:hypothetical protein|tara:strand:- start:11116 stop:11457 length:342 start_codon:yes stop_codon:yes gene_type:complete
MYNESEGMTTCWWLAHLGVKMVQAIPPVYPQKCDDFEVGILKAEKAVRHLTEHDLGKYARGSVGRTLCYRRRYQNGSPIFSPNDSPETLDEGPELEPVNLQLYRVNFPNYVSE